MSAALACSACFQGSGAGADAYIAATALMLAVPAAIAMGFSRLFRGR